METIQHFIRDYGYPVLFIGATVSCFCFLKHRLRRFQKSQPPAPGAFQQHAWDQEAVDFVCALEYAIDARIAIGAFDSVVLVESISAVDLDSLIDDVIERLRREDFDDGALGSELLHRP